MEGGAVGHNIERGLPWAQILAAAIWQWVD
jgi:hypothetical protein